MNKEEFKELVDKSKMKKAEIAKLLGVARGTIYNYLKGEKIPENKIDFIKEVLTKDKKTLTSMLDKKEGQTVEETVPFVVLNFNDFMKDPDFRTKVNVEAFKIVNAVIANKKEELESE